MSLLNVQKAGAPVLKEVSAPIDKFTGQAGRTLRKLLDDMAETMYHYEGIGISAPQVGKPIRAIVMDVSEDRKHAIEMIDPAILSSDGQVTDEEGCLSVPGIYGTVERAANVVVEYKNRFGKTKKMSATELLARCIQHEIDHLNGRLFIDVATNLREDDGSGNDAAAAAASGAAQ